MNRMTFFNLAREADSQRKRDSKLNCIVYINFQADYIFEIYNRCTCNEKML